MPSKARRLKDRARLADANGDAAEAARLRAEAAELEASAPSTSTADTPPRLESVKPSDVVAGKAPTRPGSQGQLARQLKARITQLGGTLQVAGALRGDASLEYDGRTFEANADRLAAALDQAAKEDPRLRRALENFTRSSTWGELGGAVLAIAVPLLANHGMVPPGAAKFVGAPEPPPREARPPKKEAEPKRRGKVPAPAPPPAAGITEAGRRMAPPPPPAPAGGPRQYRGPAIELLQPAPAGPPAPPAAPPVAPPPVGGGLDLTQMSGALQVPDMAVYTQ